MEKYIIAIPSYQRSEKQTTLEYLHKLGIPRELIHIFVQTEEDKAAYSQYETKANIIHAPAHGIATARNNILRHFAGSRNIVMMDDDISAISKLCGDKLVAIDTRAELADVFNRCFGAALNHNAPLFGIYPVHNAFFMSKTISTAVTVNTVLGFRKGYSIRFDESYTAKEDIELCGRLINSGTKVVRMNFLAPNAKHRTNGGGCHDTWASSANKTAVERLCKTYPKIFAPHSTKPDEVRVIHKDVKINLEKGKK